MALEASMTRAVGRLSAEIREYARSVKRWPADAYRVFMTANPDWALLHVYFYVIDRPLDEAEGQEIYDAIVDLAIRDDVGVQAAFNSFSVFVSGGAAPDVTISPPPEGVEERIDLDELRVPAAPSIAAPIPASPPSK